MLSTSPQCLTDLKDIPNKKINRCRLCGSDKLQYLFSLGEHYVNDFVDEKNIKSGPRCPITLLLCGYCSLVQQQWTAPQELLYTGNYWYSSGVTQTMKDALRDICRAVEETVHFQLGDIVLDIGGNDNTLLKSYSDPTSLFRVNFEPARNFASGKKEIELFINDFWSYETYESRVGVPAKAITAIGMFYDLDDPNKFIGDVSKALAHDGVFIAQLMCLKNMLALRDVGNLAHEHLEFYSLESLHYLFDQHGLEMFDIEKNNVNGESYRLYIRHKGCTDVYRQGGMRRLAEAHFLESTYDQPETYAKFYRQLEKNRVECRRFIQAANVASKSIFLYGASTKGNTILQYYGLDNSLISGASERSPSKFGKYTVGTGIPIFAEEEVRRINPDYMLVLPYAFLPEFLQREQKWREGGGRFLVPLPEFRVV